MKSNTQKFFIGLAVVVLALAAIACAYRFHINGYEEGYKKGRASILEDWSDSDFIDYVVTRCGEDELLRYISQDGDVVLDFCCENYDEETIIERLGLDVVRVPSSKIDSSLLSPQPTLTPQLIKSGTVVREPHEEGVAPFTVKTSGSNNYLIALKYMLPSLSNPLKMVQSSFPPMLFYVSGGNTEEFLIPLGTYEIYYVTGKTWYGEEYKFGPDSSYFKCENLFTFSSANSNYEGWTITLYPVSGGNMETSPISESEFPD